MSSIVLLRATASTLMLKHASRSLIVPTLPRSSLIISSARAFSVTSCFRKDSDDKKKAYKKKDDGDGDDDDKCKRDVSTPLANRKKKRSVKGKGKLLSTPSRLFKLLLPIKRTNTENDYDQSVEPLALLVHPRQPLSYLERLIQSELPPIQPSKGAPARPPEITFKAVNVGDALMSERDREGNISKVELRLRGGTGEGGVETGGGLGKLSTESKSGEDGMVRWSTSTELGDFVRDAARGREFIVEIEGRGGSVAVGVPSFKQRTHYQRMKLMEITKEIAGYGKLKSECDKLAQKSARRMALGGFAVLVGWWGGVYWLTFMTTVGWDKMEPITYLMGLSTVMAGYLWFLYHDREVSYRNLMHMTMSKRQMKLYTERGFDIERWEESVSDARSLRREIRNIADQYDVKWDEKSDEAGGEKVLKVLKEGDEKAKKNNTAIVDEDDDDDDEEDVVEMVEQQKKAL